MIRLGLILLAVLSITVARAHEDGAMHYPYECCHDQDCAPVTSVSYVADSSDPLPLMVVTTIHGTAAVPHNFPLSKIKHSEDGRMHACITNAWSGPTRLICLFLPDSE
jgi:hypothetical protein